ncbi:MAG: TolC family protein [bacterium]
MFKTSFTVARSRELGYAVGVALAIVAAPFGRTASAQTAASVPDTITFADAVNIALRQNTTLKASENALSLSSTVVSSRREAFLPTLQLTSTGGQTLGRSFNQSEGVVVNQMTQTLGTGISSSVTLFDGFQNVAALKQAKLNEAASTNELTRAKQTTVFTVASNFLGLITGQEQLRVQRENLAALEAQEAQIQKLVSAGVRSISDLYQQQATTASARSAVVAAGRDVELAKISVIQTLRLDPRKSYQFASPVITPTTTALSTSLDELLDRAFERRADLASDESKLSAASEGVRGASGGKLPTVSMNVGYNTAYSSATDLSLSSQFNQRRGGSVSLGVSLPLFDRGASGIAIQQARIQEENARLSLENQKQIIALEVRRAYLDFETARQQLTTAQAQQKAADLSVSTTQQRYQLGSSTLLELTQARALQLQAASAVVSAQYTLVFQRALISYYTGELDPSSVSLST